MFTRQFLFLQIFVTGVHHSGLAYMYTYGTCGASPDAIFCETARPLTSECQTYNEDIRTQVGTRLHGRELDISLVHMKNETKQALVVNTHSRR